MEWWEIPFTWSPSLARWDQGFGQVHPHFQSSAWPHLYKAPQVTRHWGPHSSTATFPPKHLMRGSISDMWGSVPGPMGVWNFKGRSWKNLTLVSGQIRRGLPGKSETHSAGGVWKHIFVPGESTSQGDKHHRFLQERAYLAQGLSSRMSFMPDPPPFLNISFPTICFRQCLIGVPAFANPIRKCPPHPMSSDLSLSCFSSARGCAVGMGQETGHSAVLQMGWDVTPDRAVRVDEAGGCQAGLVLGARPLPGLCIPGVNSSRAPELTALSPTARSS